VVNQLTELNKLYWAASIKWLWNFDKFWRISVIEFIGKPRRYKIDYSIQWFKTTLVLRIIATWCSINWRNNPSVNRLLNYKGIILGRVMWNFEIQTNTADTNGLKKQWIWERIKRHKKINLIIIYNVINEFKENTCLLNPERRNKNNTAVCNIDLQIIKTYIIMLTCRVKVLTPSSGQKTAGFLHNVAIA